MAAGNKWGYDYYSYYLQLMQPTPWIDNVVAGKYRLSAGMGLVLGQSFQLGKFAAMQNLGRTVSTLRPHTSRSEADYFQGAAATINLIRKRNAAHGRGTTTLQLTPFASYRSIDATLDGDSAARTLITSGYHRTPTEMAKKGNTHITSGGARLLFTHAPLRLGLTTVVSAIDRGLQPQRSTPYRRYYAHGKHFFNISADYTWCSHRLAMSGETATDGHGHLATINTISLQTSSQLALVALQRFYSYRYTTLYGHAFADGSHTQNESGLYIGASWSPIAHLRLQAYGDFAHHPWLQYLVSQPSESWDALFQATWQKGHWAVAARHHSQLRQKDNSDKNALIANDRHQERLTASYTNKDITLKTQAEYVNTRYKETSRGWMISQQATVGGMKVGKTTLRLSAMAAYFNTDSYQSRIYAYESQLQHEFYFPTFYGEGFRLMFQARADAGRHLRLALRAGHTKYFDRSTIGSGLQQVDHSYLTDLDMQITWKL